MGNCSDIIITGGSIKSDGMYKIGGGSGSQSGEVIPTLADGVTKLLLFQIDTSDVNDSIVIDGVDYPTNHNGEKMIYIYNTIGFHTISIDGTEKVFYFNENGTVTEQTTQGDNDLVVSGGVLNTDYTYESGVLTIKTDTPLMIKNTTPTTATTDRIEVADGISANITLAGVNIVASSNIPLRIADNSKGNVTITLADGTENELVANSIDNPGLGKISGVDSGTLTINGNGKLTTTGNWNCAGIGGYNTANIVIESGTIIANGGGTGAGIGSGYRGTATNIVIKGGTITATGGERRANSTTYGQINIGGSGIGGGADGDASIIIIEGGSVLAKVTNNRAMPIGKGGAYSPYASSSEIESRAITPTNGTENVYLLEITNTGGSAITINGKDYPSKHNGEPKIYAYLPAKTAADPNVVTVGTTAKKYCYDTANAKWLEVVDIPTEDSTVFTYTGLEQTYTIAESTYYTVSGNKQTNAGDYTVTITLRNKENTIWSDGTTEDKTCTFTIGNPDSTRGAYGKRAILRWFW